MRLILKCRRSLVALVGIACVTYLGATGAAEAPYAIAAICAALAGSNAYERKPAHAAPPADARPTD